MDSTISKGNSFTFIYPSNTSIRLKAINILWKKLLTIGQSSPYAHPNHYNSLRISKQVEKKTNWNNYSVHYFFYSFLPSIPKRIRNSNELPNTRVLRSKLQNFKWLEWSTKIPDTITRVFSDQSYVTDIVKTRFLRWWRKTDIILVSQCNT